jgi:hypothetical protein
VFPAFDRVPASIQASSLSVHEVRLQNRPESISQTNMKRWMYADIYAERVIAALRKSLVNKSSPYYLVNCVIFQSLRWWSTYSLIDCQRLIDCLARIPICAYHYSATLPSFLPSFLPSSWQPLPPPVIKRPRKPNCHKMSCYRTGNHAREAGKIIFFSIASSETLQRIDFKAFRECVDTSASQTCTCPSDHSTLTAGWCRYSHV